MKKHIIFTMGRSGSNYLSNILNAHPEAVNYGEVLGEWTLPFKIFSRVNTGRISTERYLDFIFSGASFFYLSQIYSAFSHLRKGKPVNIKRRRALKTIGIKEFSVNFERRNICNYLSSREDILVINLYRENILKRLVSLEKMQESGVAVLSSNIERSNPRNKDKIVLDIPQLLASLDLFKKEFETHQQIVRDVPQDRVLNIRYEDLFAETAQCSQYEYEIFSFLDLKPISVTSDHRKLLSDDLRQVVLNYRELEQALRNTEYECYLEH